MAKVALNIKGLSDLQKLGRIKASHDAVLAHVADFPTPNPTLASVLAAHDAAKAKMDDITTAEDDLQMLRAERDALVAAAVQLYSSLGAFVENKSGGDAAKIQAAAYDVAGNPSAPLPMPKVEGVSFTTGDDDGTGDGSWDRVKGRSSYETQLSADPITPSSWEHHQTLTKSNLHVTGQPSGQKRWLRVRAINALGPGPWSDPACCTIP